MTTRKPSDELGIDADVQWGSYDQLRVRGAINVPISELIQTRVAFYREDRSGYQRNLLLRDDDRDAFDADNFGWRAHLRLLPSDGLELLLTNNYFESKGVGPVAELVGLEADRRCFAASAPYYFNPLTHMPAFYGCTANPFPTPSFGFRDSNTSSPGHGGHPPGSHCVFPFCGEDPIYAATGFDLDRGFVHRLFENPVTAAVPRSESQRASLTPHELYLDQAASQDHKFWGFTSTLNWDTGPLPLVGATQLQSITSVQVTDLSSFVDDDGTDLDLFFGDVREESKQWSSELRWSGAAREDRVQWQASLFWMRETSESDSDFTALGIQPILIDQFTENQTYAVALAATWQLRDDLAVSLGGRATKDVRRTSLVQKGNILAGLFFPDFLVTICTGPSSDFNRNGVPDFGTPWCEQTFRQPTGDLTVEWRPSDESLVYGKIGNGYKAGGFDANQFGSYGPEHIWSFALGSKNQLFDDRLTLNLEAYHYNYRDLQLVVQKGLATRTDSADAEIRGVELEFQAEPLAGLRLFGSGSWTDSEFTEYLAVDPVDNVLLTNCETLELFPSASNEDLRFPGCVYGDYSGNELSRVPEWTFMIGAEYALDLGRFGVLRPRIQYYWQDDTWFRGFNRTAADSGLRTPCPLAPRPPELSRPSDGCSRTGILYESAEARDLQQAYHHTDARLTWALPDGRWTVEAFVVNLEDEVVYQNLRAGSTIIKAPQSAWYGAPRVYGFRVSLRY